MSVVKYRTLDKVFQHLHQFCLDCTATEEPFTLHGIFAMANYWYWCVLVLSLAASVLQ